MKNFLCSFLFLFILISCEKSDGDEPIEETHGPMYFPSTVGEWKKDTIYNKNWSPDKATALKDFLKINKTKSFMILYNGKIVMEEYFNGHDAIKSHQWFSARQTLTSAAVGIAQQEGLLDINDKVSKHLGEGWTSETLEQENLVKIKNLLNMTSGINDEKTILDKENLTYKADAGTKWVYHNVFEKLHNIIAKTSGKTFTTYLKEKIADKIGMEGTWTEEFYSSNTRSMARFGLLALNKGKWNAEQIINESYFNESVNSSQDLNPSYGYMWWLSAKKNYIDPTSKQLKNNRLIPYAPSDMYVAMGSNDQRIYVSPKKRLVIIRMGDAIDISKPIFNPNFDNEVWWLINTLIE